MHSKVCILISTVRTSEVILAELTRGWIIHIYIYCIIYIYINVVIVLLLNMHHSRWLLGGKIYTYKISC